MTENKLSKMIEELKRQASAERMTGAPGHNEFELLFDSAASVLTNFRDTLISIANCQGPVPSHQARDVLEGAGLCAHTGSVYRAPSNLLRAEGKHICHKCGQTDSVQLVPFQ